jgi:hypothetical protein
MSANRSGRVRGDDAHAAACALAGCLAEQGISNLAILDARGWTRLQARETDLPGLILEAAERGGAEIIASDRPVRVEILADRLVWFTDPGPLADALASISD